MRRLIIFLLVLLAAVLFWQRTGSTGKDLSLVALPSPARELKPLPGARIFNQPTLLAFRVELAPEALTRLRREPRKPVAASVMIDGETFTNVAVHLKGAAGSFRNVDDRPGLTLSFSKFVEGRRWEGLRKIHLNNSVQDPTYMTEYLGSELFRAANVPTPRVAFATVQLNQRQLGLYVLKEGFTEDFLKCSFKGTHGNLYDGGLLSDVDRPLELDNGKGVEDRSDLQAMVAAAKERDPARRWERLEPALEMERFVDYVALSVMVADWDGYPMNRNNYRVYFNPGNGRAVFLPHGMDQLFERPEMSIFPGFSGLVARGVIESPAGRKLYDARFPMLFEDVFRFEPMSNSIVRLADLLRPVLPDIDERARRLSRRIAARIAYLERQPLIKSFQAERAKAAAPTGQPQQTNHSARQAEFPILKPGQWRPEPAGDARLVQMQAEGRQVLQISAQGQSTASWRATVKLKPGRYRFEGQAHGAGIEAVSDAKGTGGGLRVTGAAQPRTNTLAGDSRWVSLAYEFEVPEPEREVGLVCELRARKGRIQFDVDSLRVVPLGR